MTQIVGCWMTMIMTMMVVVVTGGFLISVCLSYLSSIWPGSNSYAYIYIYTIFYVSVTLEPLPRERILFMPSAGVACLFETVLFEE
jgi:hypothetical protein